MAVSGMIVRAATEAAKTTERTASASKAPATQKRSLWKTVVLAVAMLLGQTQTKAAEQPEFTVEQALNISGGLDQLGSYETVDKDGKPTKVYYKFSGDLRILIAVNIDIGRSVQSRYQTARNALIMQLSDGTGNVPIDKSAVLSAELYKLMNAPSRAGFERIKAADLKLDENAIPAPVLSLIVPIIDR